MRLPVLLTMLGACQGTATDSFAPDAGAPGPGRGRDAGPPRDAGQVADAGDEPRDASTQDAAAELDAAVDAGPAPFDGRAEALTVDERTRMTGVSWRSGCPVALDALVRLDMPHWGFDGEVHRGQLIVATEVADDVLSVFAELYQHAFPIASIRPVEDYDGDDDRSMADNNTSAFNCRRTTGGNSWSAHSYGNAIDINPVQNPYILRQTVLPPSGAEYADRGVERPGMLVEGGVAVAAFDRIGWGWGGRWTSPKDYQHVSLTNR